MKQSSPRILILMAAVFLLLLSLTGCSHSDSAPDSASDSIPDSTQNRSQDDAPPKELWYLGGAPILDDFSTSGGPAEPDGVPTTIVVYVPLNLVQDGFSAGIIAETADGEQEDLLLHKTLPTGYYTISEDIYQKYESMTLNLSYSWQGELMSMRVIDLFTHEDLVPAYPSKSR